MKISELCFDLSTLREGYLDHSFAVSEIIREVLRRIDEDDPKIWISVDTESNLLKMATGLEDKDPTDLPLYGIPFAVKDNIDVANLPTTAACSDFKYFPSEDATVVALLRKAGAIPIGKTNLDQFATGLVGVRSPYGIPGNAFDADYIPGGSSSGSAISVALGQVSFALGTDTAGSGRVPACFNNLIGLKPTRGLLSAKGVVPACRSLDCVSIFALNASDAQRVLGVARKFDDQDPFSRPNPELLDTTKLVDKQGLVFGIPKPTQLLFFGNEDYQNLYLQAVKRLDSLGYQSKVIDIESFLRAAKLLYEGPWVAERYWAIRDLIESAPEALHPTTRAVIEKGDQFSAVDTFDVIYKLSALKQLADKILDEIDFIVTPTAGTHYTIAELESDPIELNSNLGYYTNFMNLLDLSAIAVPTGFTAKKMPFGVTLFASAFHDEKLLAIADRLQKASELPLGTTQTKRYPPLQPTEYPSQPILVCGAHMSGLPLNHQLTDKGASLAKRCKTATKYRLYALPDTTPPKPGMARDEASGVSIDVEIWDLPHSQWSAFLQEIPSPLGIGTVELEDGSSVKGFICEPYAIKEAKDVSEFGSWRNYINSLS